MAAVAWGIIAGAMAVLAWSYRYEAKRHERNASILAGQLRVERTQSRLLQAHVDALHGEVERLTAQRSERAQAQGNQDHVGHVSGTIYRN